MSSTWIEGSQSQNKHHLDAQRSVREWKSTIKNYLKIEKIIGYLSHFFKDIFIYSKKQSHP